MNNLEEFMKYCEEHQHTPSHELGENPRHRWLVDRIRQNPEIVGVHDAVAVYRRVYKIHPERKRFFVEVDNVIVGGRGWINLVEVKTGRREKSVPDGKKSLIRSGRILLEEHGLKHLRLILYQVTESGLACLFFAHITNYGLVARKNGGYWKRDNFFTPLEYFDVSHI